MVKINQKRWLVGLAITVIVAGFFTFKDLQKPRQDSGKILGTQQEKLIQYQGEDGKTVFELLVDKHDAEFTESELGVFVTTIGGLENSENEFWVYYVDDEMGPVASDKFETKNDQEIEWRYEALTF